MNNIIKKYIKGETIESEYMVFCNDKRLISAQLAKGFIGKAENGRTIAISIYGEKVFITDVKTALAIKESDFEEFLNGKYLFKTVEKGTNSYFKALEESGYIDQMRKREEWGIYPKYNASLNCGGMN